MSAIAPCCHGRLSIESAVPSTKHVMQVSSAPLTSEPGMIANTVDAGVPEFRMISQTTNPC
jgi:hypothetical protein